MEFTLEQVQLKKKFSEFVTNEIIPFAQQQDKEERILPEVLEKIKKSGYLGAMISKEYGGKGWNTVTLGLLNEEIGKGCASVRSLLTVHGMVALGIQRWGTKEQKDEYLNDLATGKIIGAFALTEPNAGSDAKSVETQAIPSENGYILNGEKKWITMGQIADIFLMIAQCEGKPTAFIVKANTPGIKITPINGLLGARASMAAKIEMKDCQISKDCMVGRIGMGVSHVALSCLDYGRFTIACGCVGSAQACMEYSVRYARKREQFNMKIRQNQLVQKMITEMSVNIKAARYLCYNAADLKDKGDPDAIAEVWSAKYFATKMFQKVACDAVQIFGAKGCSSEYPVERFYRDAKINEIIEGTSQIHEILIASNTIRSIY
ncbi:MAG: acyl-CoA dehydrogenase family protein [Clostridium sp.]